MKTNKKREQDFPKFIREKRLDFIKPYELAYTTFIALGYDQKPASYFYKNASIVIKTMREQCWKNFLIAEEEFSKAIYKSLYADDIFHSLSNHEAIDKFIDLHTNDFYVLSLSNTQSRRCRAGAEFEAILELLLMGSDLMMDSQGFLSSGIFEKHSLGKAVDIISPGVIEYEITKRNCSLISCKTTLRERWAEVAEEKDRTGASEVYLATLDNKISKRTLKNLNDNNVIPVITDDLKKSDYADKNNVITYEELLKILKTENDEWSIEKYSPETLSERINLIDKQISKHRSLNHAYAVKKYNDLKSNLCNLPDD